MVTQGDKSPATRWLIMCGLACGSVSAWVAQIALGGIAHVSDEIAYTLQSRLFASVQRVGPFADNPSMWSMPFWDVNAAMFSPFPPGWPALLAPFEALGLAAWLNPLAASLLPWVVYRIALTVVDGAVARTAALLVAFSPGVWLLAGSKMPHTSVLLALGVLMVVALEMKASKWPWFWGALAALYVILARPFDALLLAGPLLALGLAGARDARMRWVWVGLPAVGVGLVGFDNYQLTGDVFQFPMSAWFDQWQDRIGCNRLGFGADVGCAPTLGTWGHSPLKALKLMALAWGRFDGLLLGVHGGTLIAALGAWRLGARGGLIWVALTVFGYGLYWSPGLAYGARFWHPLYLVVPIAMAAVLVRVPTFWRRLSVIGLAVVGISRVAPELSDKYWCVDGGLAEQIKAAGIQEGVVFMKGEGSRFTAWPKLGVDEFVCDPMLEAGDGWLLANPAQIQGGLQIRHALPDLEQTRAFMAAHHPGAEAWVLIHDVKADMRALRPLGVLAPLDKQVTPDTSP